MSKKFFNFHEPKTCKWPLEINPLTGKPKEYNYRTGKRGGYGYNRNSKVNAIIGRQWVKENPKPLHWRKKLWARLSMEMIDKKDAAMYAYELSEKTNAGKLAHAITTRNRNDPLIHEYTKEIAEQVGGNILDLANNAENEAVRLNASKDVLDRLGLRAPERIEIDDKRELTVNDVEAIGSVIEILSGKNLTPITDAEIVEEQEHAHQ